MAKNIAKSIRMSEEVNEYIANYRGNGFNEKFENIIMDAMKSEPERIVIIKNLDIQIEKKKKELQELLSRFNKLNPHLQTALRINTMIRELKQELEEIK